MCHNSILNFNTRTSNGFLHFIKPSDGITSQRYNSQRYTTYRGATTSLDSASILERVTTFFLLLSKMTRLHPKGIIALGAWLIRATTSLVNSNIYHWYISNAHVQESNQQDVANSFTMRLKRGMHMLTNLNLQHSNVREV